MYRLTLIIILIIFLSAILVPQLALSAKVGLDNPLGNDAGDKDMRNTAGVIIKAVMGIIGSLAILMFFYGGFMWLTAMGSPEKIKKGQQTLFWAAVGIAVLFASYAILRFTFQIVDPGFVS